MSDAIDCTLEDTIELTISPTRDDKKASVKGDTVVWLTSPEHAGVFTPNADPATGAKFQPTLEGAITIAVAAQTLGGAILKDKWQINVTGHEATKLNLRARVASRSIDASVATGQGPAA